jgi:hypothetical protein
MKNGRRGRGVYMSVSRSGQLRMIAARLTSLDEIFGQSSMCTTFT